MSLEENKATVRRFLEEHVGRSKLDLLDELFAPDYRNHGPGPGNPPMGLESVKREAATFYTVFPDLQVTVEDLVAEGDRVAARVTITATHQGELEGIPATGRRMTMTGMEFFRLEDGKIVEDWPMIDMLGLLRQLEANTA